LVELFQVRVTECCDDTVPVPFRDWTVGEFDALLVKDRVPEAAPLACGVKVTAKEADEPAAMVVGNEMPDRTNSLFVMLADETVTAAPVAFRLPLSEELAPTTTFPKLSVAGETAN
jgi:methylmalonyl-CoA mutase N-terminal domain/subunit